MKKLKAAGLIFGLMVALSVTTVGIPKLNYYFVSPAQVANNGRSPAVISGLPPKGAQAKPGSNGLDAYFNFLVTVGAFGLAPL